MDTKRKVIVVACLLAALAVVFAVAFQMFWSLGLWPPPRWQNLVWVFTKLGMMTAVVFGAVAFWEPEWTRADAGRTARYVAWGSVLGVPVLLHVGCAMALLFLAAPFFLVGARLGHEIGHARHAYRAGARSSAG